MNTIPTTTKRLRVPYTVVGGRKVDKAMHRPGSLSLVLLNRGGKPFRSAVLADLEALGVRELISIEGPGSNYDIEALSRRFPYVRFLILHEAVTDGERVNIGIEETSSRFALVMWNDMQHPSALSSRLVGRIVEQDALCTVPVLTNQRKDTVPSIQAPAFHGRRLQVVPLQPASDGAPTIFPFDYCGIYSRERFALMGGYDYLVTNPYWQKLDFGFRSFMWGERIVCNTSLRMAYTGDLPAENASRDESYRHFYLKNLAIRYVRDSGRLPVSRAPAYVLRSRGDVVSAVREFGVARRWVWINRYRFKLDARSVTELWETPEQ